MWMRPGVIAGGTIGTPPEPPDTTRVPEVSEYNERAFPIPQAFADYIASDFVDTNTHPPMSGFTHMSTKSGNWSDSSVWDVGVVPGTNAVVMIMNGHTVIYDVESSTKIKDIHVEGQATFRWDTTQDTLLWVDTIMCEGKFIMGKYNSPIPESTTLGKPRAEIVFWQSEAPGRTTRLGLNTMGPVRINGAKKADRLFLSTTALVGSSSITLSDVDTSNWRVGDTIVVGSTSDYVQAKVDPQYTGPTRVYAPIGDSYGQYDLSSLDGDDIALGYATSFDEKRTITGISGDIITLDSNLSYEHTVITETLYNNESVMLTPVVVNLSRSIRFRSADPSTRQTRAHIMFMFNDDIQVRWAESKDTARTDIDPSLVIPSGEIAYSDANHTTVLTDPNNVRGRYAFHLHQLGGPTFGAKQAVLFGLSVWGDTIPFPGWGITQHSSRAAIENCVIYNGRGAGMVSENGSEIGQWLNNTVMSIRGDGFGATWGSRHERWKNHNGHMGVAYENQSRAILQQGNIATCSNFGWLFHQQIAPFYPVTPPGQLPPPDAIPYVVDGFSLRYPNPLVWGGNSAQTPEGITGGAGAMFGGAIDTYGATQAQIPDFFNNYAYSCNIGFRVAHRRAEERTDITPMIARHFHCWGVQEAFVLVNYSHLYGFYDSLWGRNTKSSASGGVGLGNVSWEFMFVNLCIKNMGIGINSGGSINYDGFPINIKLINVDTPVLNQVIPTSPGGNFRPDEHPAYGVMGPWSSASTYPVYTRPNVIYTDADLPLPYPLTNYGAYGGVEPSPGTPKPYFYLEPSSQLTLRSGYGNQQIFPAGAIVDAVGVKRFGEWQSSESSLLDMTSSYPKPSNYHGPPERLVERNGCFNDNGTWMMRMWFISYDRLSGDPFVFPIDITLTGFDSSFLAANTVDPASTKPDLPLKAEVLRTSDIANGVAPSILTDDQFSVRTGTTLSLWLRSDTGTARWSLTGGDDQSLFEIATIGGKQILRWVSDTTHAATSPADANGDNVYKVTVTASDLAGNTSNKTIEISVVDYFFDNWMGTGSITSSGLWTEVPNSGSLGGFTLSGDGKMSSDGTKLNNFVYTRDLLGTGQYVEVNPDSNTTGGIPDIMLALIPGSNFQWYEVMLNDGHINIYQVAASKGSNPFGDPQGFEILGKVSGRNGNQSLTDVVCRAEFERIGSNDVVRLYGNNVLLGTVSFPALPLIGKAVGLRIPGSASRSPAMKNGFAAGALYG